MKPETPHIAQFIYQCLTQGVPLVLAKIISRTGSAPRTAGTQMVVTRDAQCFGTIGGGLLEAKVIGACARVLAEGKARFMQFDLKYEDVAGMDMICGGDLEILLDPIQPGAAINALFDQWWQWIVQGTAGAFVMALQQDNDGGVSVQHALVAADGRGMGRWPNEVTVPAELMASITTAREMLLLRQGTHELIITPILRPARAIIVGAGHVAQPTARLAALVDFRVTVLDDRAGFANAARFPDAAEVRVLADFTDPFGDLGIDENSFIVIVTRGHLHDRLVLARALGTPADYIGMIGSRRKRDAIFKRLRTDGFGDADLERVRSPIGLPIGAQTPEEIAVSIVAEMIAHNNGPMKR
ncbi:MAG: XdhC family protein [Desulfatitalea sp.]|nr:XdhC family protein [Desulfatitalea sp.]